MADGGIGRHHPHQGAAPLTNCVRAKRLLIDDGTCPAGQIKEISTGKSINGVKRLRRCVHH
jgi:hypothetical protein